jgi:FkbM family methyltransferase
MCAGIYGLVVLMAFSVLPASCNEADCSDLPADGVCQLQLSNRVHKHEHRGCALPAGAKWCKVGLGLDFDMAVYGTADIVSGSICSSGTWELSTLDLQEIGTPGNALDIGANLGFYTLVLAASGWNVTAFEPMPQNIALLEASLCQNPALKSKVNLLKFGLGAKDDQCRLVSGNTNTGDGIVECGEEAKKPVQTDYVKRADLTIRRLDDILAQQPNMEHVDFVKMDVEGFECQVMSGAPSLLSKIRPRLIQSEVWPTMKGCSHASYFGQFSDAHYTVAKDRQCQIADSSSPTQIDNRYMCVQSDTASSLLEITQAFEKSQRSIVWFRRN